MSNDIETACAAIGTPDELARQAVQARLDGKTKPRGSLGRLEELAGTLAAVLGNPLPARLPKAIVVMAADHGISAEGVSAYPAEVTAQMVKNFATGSAALNVLARRADARVVVVDMGVFIPCDLADVESIRIGPGTNNFARAPAMTLDQARRAVSAGIQLAERLIDKEKILLIGLGEMGIGNTSAASAMTATFCSAAVEQVTGRGTGIDADRQRHKIAVIEKALALHRPDPAHALEVLAKVGGFEIAGLTGVVLGAAGRRVPIVMDGFITGAAVLAAAALCPRVRDFVIAAHCSAEPGQRVQLEHLQLQPLLELELRLGEGSGAALALPLIDAALALVHEMASFAEAGVTDAGA